MMAVKFLTTAKEWLEIEVLYKFSLIEICIVGRWVWLILRSKEENDVNF